MSKIDVDSVTEEYFARIHRAALILSGNPWDADDLAQETFLVLSRSHGAFRGQSNVYTWLYGVLLNLERKRRQKRGLHHRKLNDLVDKDMVPNEPGPPADAAVEVAEWKQSLWSRVAQLPDGQRQALVLRFSQGMRYEDIAQVMECPLGTVKSRIFHGLGALRKLLESDEEIRLCPNHTSEDENYGLSAS